MPLSRELIERRAVKTGVKASKKRGHLVSKEELLSLRVQTMPTVLRVSLVLCGVSLLIACWFAWPSESNTLQGLEAVAGIFSILFGAFGIRRTLSNIIDSVDAFDFAGAIVELIADAVSNIDL